jgi:hypothetical protein
MPPFTPKIKKFLSDIGKMGVLCHCLPLYVATS